MKNSKWCYFLLMFISLIFSCKKNGIETVTPVPEVESVKYLKDSLSFTIEGSSYVLLDNSGRGIGNTQINLKAFDDSIPGRQAASMTAGKYYYGEKDSTLYSAMFKMVSSSTFTSSAEILFTKKYGTNELRPGFVVLVPTDQSQVFKVGKQSFATDFRKENTQEGIVMDLYINGQALSTTVPGFSIALQSHMKDIQKNSSFEITKVEKVEGDIFRFEAKFTLNVYNTEARLYRVENGYLRKTFSMSHNLGFTLK
jgi:hypothetical protein